jgi:hypothetical protein
MSERIRVEQVRKVDGTTFPINQNVSVDSIIDRISHLSNVRVIDRTKTVHYAVRKGGTRDIGLARVRTITFAPITDIPHANFTLQQLLQAAEEMTTAAGPVWEALERDLGLVSSEGSGEARKDNVSLSLPLKVYTRELSKEEVVQAIAEGKIPERLQRGIRWVEEIGVLGFPSAEDAEIAAMEPYTVRSIAALGQ